MASQDDKDWEEYQLGLQGTGTGSAFNQQGINDQSKKDGCFPAKTEVLTPYGWKRIADLFEGSVVLSYASDGKLTPCKVAKRLQHAPSAIITVHTNNSDISIEATKIHAINTTRGWLRIIQLRTGDEIFHITEDGKLSKLTVLSVENNGRIEPVYNLIVEKNYTFVPRGCIAHSFSYFRRIRIMLHELARYAKIVVAMTAELARKGAFIGNINKMHKN